MRRVPPADRPPFGAGPGRAPLNRRSEAGRRAAPAGTGRPGAPRAPEPRTAPRSPVLHARSAFPRPTPATAGWRSGNASDAAWGELGTGTVVQGVAEASFGEADAVVRRGVEVADPVFPGGVDRLGRGVVVQRGEEAAQRSAAEAETGDGDPRGAESLCLHAVRSSRRARARVLPWALAPGGRRVGGVLQRRVPEWARGNAVSGSGAVRGPGSGGCAGGLGDAAHRC